MALDSAAKVLFYWSPRYGALPIAGGKPVHTRSSAASWVDQQGILQSAIVNTPRFEWATIFGERRQVMRLEAARTNVVTFSNDFSNAAWTKSASMTVTTGVPDPKGGNNACTLTAGAANQEAYRIPAAGSSIARVNTMWVRRRTGTGLVRLWDQFGNYTTIALTEKWQRFLANGPVSTAKNIGIIIVTSGDAVDVFDGQQEDFQWPSSSIETTSAAVTRASEQFYWDFLAPPQALAMLIRFIERGTVFDLTTNPRIIQIGKSDNTAALLAIYAGPTGFYRGFRSFTGSAESILAVAPAYGDFVDLLLTMDGAGVTQITQSINGGAVTSGAATAAQTLGASWSDTRLWLNSIGNSAFGLADYAEVKIVKLGDMIGATRQELMDELRNFEMAPSGEVIA